MTTLEKILQEINATIERYGKNTYITEDVTEMCYGLNIAKDIIKKYLSENHCSECSRRKFYQIGYEDAIKAIEPVSDEFLGDCKRTSEKYKRKTNGLTPVEEHGVVTPSKEDNASMLIGHTVPYKGYVGTIEYSSFDKVFYGKVLRIKALVNYEASDVIRLCEEFKKAVDDYISFVGENKE